VNCFVRDIVKACSPLRLTVTGDFAARGGLSSRMTAAWSKTEMNDR
jgi:NADPH-dependent 7-cyano-7-deazaguanine reductase QueF